jgi:hypothetical protein
MSAIALSRDSQFHARSKHIDIRHHFIRFHIESGAIETPHVSSQENLADAFTKPLAYPQFSYLMNRLMGTPPT